MLYQVNILRREIASIEVEAETGKAARAEAERIVNTASCIADLDLEWDIDGDYRFESMP